MSRPYPFDLPDQVHLIDSTPYHHDHKYRSQTMILLRRPTSGLISSSVKWRSAHHGQRVSLPHETRALLMVTSRCLSLAFVPSEHEAQSAPRGLCTTWASSLSLLRILDIFDDKQSRNLFCSKYVTPARDRRRYLMGFTQRIERVLWSERRTKVRMSIGGIFACSILLSATSVIRRRSVSLNDGARHVTLNDLFVQSNQGGLKIDTGIRELRCSRQVDIQLKKKDGYLFLPGLVEAQHPLIRRSDKVRICSMKNQRKDLSIGYAIQWGSLVGRTIPVIRESASTIRVAPTAKDDMVGIEEYTR
ncbi:hypothetical protein BDN72DRAFT_864555 [Pluteus cervinus]|uniref:Uncharacterized protein n=1 Tax=Pluteus cervinus TaxID=181527 RepID=A0ACD3A3C8_9AGAR|nr:hypothetical protein BDN72DRAFT_864555 [Pluteus cervinus]